MKTKTKIMKTKIKISKIKYFETRRGVGYIVTTNVGHIYNDGNGGETYVDGNWKGENLTEWELEDLINEYEGVSI
jgi:hypothetical protein